MRKLFKSYECNVTLERRLQHLLKEDNWEIESDLRVDTGESLDLEFENKTNYE